MAAKACNSVLVASGHGEEEGAVRRSPALFLRLVDDSGTALHLCARSAADVAPLWCCISLQSSLSSRALHALPCRTFAQITSPALVCVRRIESHRQEVLGFALAQIMPVRVSQLRSISYWCITQLPLDRASPRALGPACNLCASECATLVSFLLLCGQERSPSMQWPASALPPLAVMRELVLARLMRLNPTARHVRMAD